MIVLSMNTTSKMSEKLNIRELIVQLPNHRLEEYRITPVAKLFDGVQTMAEPSVGDPCCQDPSPCAHCGHNVTVNNGYTDSSITSLDSGIVYGSLATAIKQMPSLVAKYLNRLAEKSSDSYSKLCEVMAADGAFIYVPEGLDVDDPFNVTSCYVGDNTMASAERHLIIIEAGAKAKVVFDKRVSSADSYPFASEIVEIFVGEKAELETAHICDIKTASAISHNYSSQQADSKHTSIDMGVRAEVLRVNRIVDLVGRGAHNAMYGIFVSGKGELFDYHTTINHMVEDCTSEEHFKDLIAVGGVGAFKGRIYVAQDAQRTEAFQQNNNILLGNGAKIFTKPELEIYADDVKCTHGATIGRPDDEAIYYMRQRGIGEVMARRLQMMGFVNDIVGRCGIGCVASDIVERVTNKIENL